MIQKIKLSTFFKYYSRESEHVVLLPSLIEGFFTNSLEHDLILVAILAEQKKTYSICIGKDYKNIKNKIVFYNPSVLFNFKDELDYSAAMIRIAKEMEGNGNQVFYSSYEISFWENKAFMHRMFDDLNVKTPKTNVFSSAKEVKDAVMEFPCLLKEEHSYASLGLHKLNSMEEAITLVESEAFKARNENILIQKLLNIKKDLRVILMGDEILLHYWRVNPSKEWKPTSTSHGSGVDFVTFPEKWRTHIIETFKKLNLTTGAFDIAWDNDDLDSEPYFLEVSPNYQPNPPVDLSGKPFNYGQYKKKFLWKDSWDYNYINIIYAIKQKWIKSILT
ncbi:MAG: hypothetical protein H0X62_06395 [Bacteroidetes bacterium]|nr:hypothetical protein [Bacteroidota bacterium]